MGVEVIDVRNRGRAVVAGVLGIVLAVVFVVTGHVAAIIVLGVLIPIAIRFAQLSVHAAGDDLDVRNFWRTAHVERADIASFAVEDAMDTADRRERQRVVYAFLKDGECRRLAATRRGYVRAFRFLPARASENEADEICARLNTWLKADP